MRIHKTMLALACASAVLTGPMAAAAQKNVYTAERGHWFVGLGGSACRAVNRPAVDFNGSPYNALNIVVRSVSRINLEVFFWPGAVAGRELRLIFEFAGGPMLTLDAQPGIGDYALVSVEEPKLWRLLEDADRLDVRLYGEPPHLLMFDLQDIDWVLERLTECSGLLPKG